MLFTVEDDTGEMRTLLTGAKAVISIFDPSGQNLLFWMPCTRLPNDLNANIPLGGCHINNFCPTMQVMVKVSVEWTGGGVQGSTILSPGPTSPCPPTSAWLAVVELVTPAIPYFPGDAVQIQIRSINSPGALAVFKFALKILSGVTFLSFDSTYSTVSMVNEGILSVMGDSSNLASSTGPSTDVLGVLTLRLDAAFSGVALVVQIIANTFQFTLANAMPYAMSTRTSGFTCRYDGYVDMLADVQRITTLIAIPRRRLLINWRTLQPSARSFPTSIDVVGVGNVMRTFSMLTSAQCSSLSPGQLLVQSCASIQANGTLGSSQAMVRVRFQESAVTTVNLTVAVARAWSVKANPALSGLSGRFKVFARLWDGRDDIFTADVDATPYLGTLSTQGARVNSEQWTCFKSGIGFTIGNPVLLTGPCTPASQLYPPESLFIFTGGTAAGMGAFVLNGPQITKDTPLGAILLFGVQGLLITTGVKNAGTNSTHLVSVNPVSQTLTLSNYGASAGCIRLNMLPAYPGFKSGLVPVYPPAPSSLQITLSSMTLVPQQELSGLVASSTFVTGAVLRFSDGTSNSVLMDMRLQVTTLDPHLLDVAGMGAMARTLPGEARLSFQLAGMDCVSTSVTVRILPTSVQSATLICPTCPSWLTLRDDPLSQQLPGTFPSSIPAMAFLVRRVLADGRILDRFENITVGPSGLLDSKGLVIGLIAGPLQVSTQFTSEPLVVQVIERFAVSYAIQCNQGQCGNHLKLAPPGDGAGLPPFSYTTELNLSLSLTLVDGSTSNFPWLPQVACSVNSSQIQQQVAYWSANAGCTVPLVYGAILVDAVFSSQWKLPTPSQGTSSSMFVHRVSNLVLSGPQILFQLHCSLVWEEAYYTTTAILTDGTSGLVQGVYRTTPPLVILSSQNPSTGTRLKADWQGGGQLTVAYWGNEAMLQVQATRSSRYLSSVALDFLPSRWATAHDRPLDLLPLLSPPLDSPPGDAAALYNFTSRILRWTSSAPEVIRFSPSLGTMTLLSDYYQSITVTSELLACPPFSGASVSQDLTVNVVPSQAGEIDFGEEETGLPVPPSEVGSILTIPLYIYSPSNLRSYTLEVYLPEIAVEPLECTGSGVSNSQCGVVSRDGKTFFRSVGAFTQSGLTGRVLMASIKLRVLLDALVAMRVTLIQAVVGLLIIPPQEYVFVLRLGSPASQSPVTTSRRILPTPPLQDPFGRVYGDTNGDGDFTSADVLFLEYYLVVSVFKPPQMICVPLPDSECQSTDQLTQWQLMQLKPVRNPNLPATRPDGSDVLFLLRALVGKAFFLTSLETISLAGRVQVSFRLCDYNQDCAPENAAAQVQITAPGNQHLGFNSQSSYDPSNGVITVDCTRTFDGGFIVSTQATTVTFDEPMAGLRISTQSLDSTASPDSAVAYDRRFLFTPLGPISLFNILASENSLLDLTPNVDYLPTTICKDLCEDVSLFLDTTVAPPVWINETALTVPYFFAVTPAFQGFWPVFQPSGAVFSPTQFQSILPSDLPNMTLPTSVWVGSTFNVTVTPPAGVLLAVYRIQAAQPLTQVYGGEVHNNMLAVFSTRYPFARLTFAATKAGDHDVTVTMTDYFPTSMPPSASVVTRIRVLAPFISRFDVQPQCASVILWSKLWGLTDEPCTVKITPVWLPAPPSSVSPVWLVCQTYPCVLQAFGQQVRPVIPTYIPTRPRMVIQKPALSLGERSQWRVSCSLQGIDQAVTFNQRALEAGMIKSTPANALLITKEGIRGVKVGTATVMFAGVVSRIDVTDTINPPKSLRGFVFTGVDFNINQRNITANFKKGPLLAGGKAYIFLQAVYSGGYNLLLDPKPKTDNITLVNASSDIIVSQIDGSITVKPDAQVGPERPIVMVQYRGILLNLTAPVVPLLPISITACCDLTLAGPASSLAGLLNSSAGSGTSDFQISNITAVFQDRESTTTMTIGLTDPRIQLRFETSVLEFRPSTGWWSVLSNAPAQAMTQINITYVQPYSLVKLQTQIRVTLVSGQGFEVTPSTLRLRRIHCSLDTFEESPPFQAQISTPTGQLLQVPVAELTISSDNPGIVSVRRDKGKVIGLGVGVAVITVEARGFTATCMVQVLDQNVLVQSIFISRPGSNTDVIEGPKGSQVEVRVGGRLEGGQEMQDIWFLSPALTVQGPLSLTPNPSRFIIIQGNSGPTTPGVIGASIQECLGLGTNLTTSASVRVQLTPVITPQQPADVLVRILPTSASSASIRLVGSGILGFYVQIQTDITRGITCIPGIDLPLFADCTPDAPTQGGIILAGAAGSPMIPTSSGVAELELAIIQPAPFNAWGFVEIYTGLSAVRIPIVAGLYGLTSPVNPVSALMPTLPIVDSSVIIRQYSELFRWPAVPQSVRNALFNLLLLVYKQRNVDSRLYSNDFELSAMFRVTDRFMQPDTNGSRLVVSFHTDQLPPIQGGVYIPSQVVLQVPATYVQDGWYVVEWIQKIPVLSVPISFQLTTAFANISWPWEIATPLMTGVPLPNCPQSATATGTFLATYYLTGNVTQALVDRIACSIKVAARRIMVSSSTRDGRIALSIGLESLERVHQANMVIMSQWFTDQLTNLTGPMNSTQEDNIVERANLAYINDTRDPPNPCPNGFFLSKNGSYTRLPPHAFPGQNCYDMLCEDGYTSVQDADPQCVPNPVTLDIIWICVSAILALVAVISLVILCVQFMHSNQGAPKAEDHDIVLEQPPTTKEDQPFYPPPFSEEDDGAAQFRNIIAGIQLDDYSTMMLEGEFSPIPLYEPDSSERYKP